MDFLQVWHLWCRCNIKKNEAPCPRALWTKLVWFKGKIPKHSFMCWLATLNKLSTRDKQVKHNPLLEAKCVFCNSAESRGHLFFSCDFPSKIWLEVISKVGKNGAIPVNWSSMVDWANQPLKRNTGINILVLAKIGLQDCIDHICMEETIELTTKYLRQWMR